MDGAEMKKRLGDSSILRIVESIVMAIAVALALKLLTLDGLSAKVDSLGQSVDMLRGDVKQIRQDFYIPNLPHSKDVK